MAEQDNEEQDKELGEDAGEIEPKGSSKKWIIIAIVVLVLGGGGYAAWDFFLAEKLLGKEDQQTAETEQSTEEAESKEFGAVYEMDPFIVNLLGQEGKRYLKTTIELEVDNDDVKNALAQRKPQLRDAILLILTSKSFEDIFRPEGKLRLKNELVSRINQSLPDAGIRSLYFTEFVVQ